MIKIGILIKDFEKLSNWELRIIEKIIGDQSLKLSVLIKDGRNSNVSNQNSNLFQLLFSKNGLSKIIFKIQTRIERKLYPEKVTVDKNQLKKYLKDVPSIYLNPTRKGFLDVFNLEDSNKVKGFDLDIILRHEFNIIRGDILNASKYGIWSFHHADNSINRGGPSCFWEISLNQPTVGVTLQKLTPELDGGLVIDKAFFNKTISYVKTYTNITESSVSLLFKNIDNLKRGIFSPTKSLVYYNPLYRAPKIGRSLKYLWHFYTKMFQVFWRKFNSKLFNVRYSCWTLFIGKGDFLNATLFRLKPAKLPKNEFWADPFLFKYKESHFVFFENFCYKKKIGKISCGRIEKNKIIDVCDVLELPYHLSYPFIFKENDEIFMMPETSGNKRLEVYKCIQFPDKWELYSTAFEGEIVYDAHFYDDDNNNKWLFVNKCTETIPINNELYIYKVDSLKLNKIESHHQNPVIINAEIARNGGAIFKYENEIYRPSQYDAEGIYGRGLNINKIKKLSLENYEEELVTRVMPNFYKGLISTHHLHQIDDMFVIDAAHKKLI